MHQSDQYHQGEKTKNEASVAIPKQKINDKSIIGIYIPSQLYTWVNYTYGVQLDLNSHTNDGMSFGYRILHCNPRKNKLNTKISTEDKLVGVSDHLTYNIWIFCSWELKDMTLKRTSYSKTTRVQ